ncbi:MAG: formate transporter FocA [Chloroflexi bacterium 44-23]|nr:MAG: formate transporter FocA [Chloroflexi bacterium 44-23]
MEQETQFDSILPAGIAKKAEEIGVRKVKTAPINVFLLAILAGAFIALGSVFYTTVLAGSAALPYGMARFLGGLAFCLGLILVVLAGAELFTGNNLIVMAWASKSVGFADLLQNWGIVFLGNFVGAIGTAVLMLLTKQYTFGSSTVGETALKIATAKVHLGFGQAIVLGILCNSLVCLAVWLTYGARSSTDKILAIIFPISAFVAAGFEHSVANMYLVPFGLLVQQFDPSFVVSLGDKVNLAGLTWGAFFLKNLLPVTIGNIIGGAGLVGIIYWVIYLRRSKRTEQPSETLRSIQ